MQRLAGISVFVSSLVSVWLGNALIADAQRTTTREYAADAERVVEEERSVVRNRGTAPRTGASPRPTSTARARQAPQAPELLEDRAGEAPQRVIRSRSAVPETRTDGSPVPEGYAVDPESGEMVEYADRHQAHDHDSGYFGDTSTVHCAAATAAICAREVAGVDSREATCAWSIWAGT
jgi:hypothetical protein